MVTMRNDVNKFCFPSECNNSSVAVIVGVVCGVVFAIIRVLVGGVIVYLILRVRGRWWSGSISSPPLPPAAMYEKVDVMREDKRSHDIQLTANEAYASVNKDYIHTSCNTAYGQVQL